MIIIILMFSVQPDPLHPLSLFHHCDTAVLNQMAQLSQFVKGSSDNDLDRRSKLIKDLKDSQHNLLIVLMHTVDMVIPEQKMARDFRVKYPDELPMDQFYGKQKSYSVLHTTSIHNYSYCLHSELW